MPPQTSPENAQARRDELLAVARLGRLKKGEQEELAGLLAADGAADLKLESEAPAAAGLYLHEYAWYADSANLDIWPAGTSVASRIRRIKSWVKRGREHRPVADYPPLDNPSQLAAWMVRVKMRDQVKWQKIRALAAPPPVAGATAAPAGAGQPAPPAPPASASFDLSAVVAASGADNLTNYRRLTAAAYELYGKALLQNSPDVDARFRAYTAASAELRKAESEYLEQQQRYGTLVNRDLYAAELLRVHQAIAGSWSAVLAEHHGAVLTPELSDRIIAAVFRPVRSGEFGIAATDPRPPPAPLPAAA